MSSATVAVPASAAALGEAPAAKARGVGWTLGEFMLVGGATIVLFPILWVMRKSIGLDASEYAVGFLTFYGAYVVNDPHFAVTYVLFYKDARRRVFDASLGRSYRARYIVSGFVVPAILATWAGLAFVARSAEALGRMIELMYLLVGWHYVKQGFGVLAVLSARRGTSFGAGERRIVLAHCYAAWAYAWASPAMPAGEFEEKGVVYRAMAHPRWLELTTGSVLIVSVAALAGMLVRKWRREGSAVPLVPLVAYLVTVWWWTIYSTADRLVQYMIPALHSVQYFYFVWLMKKNEARAFEGPPYFGRPVALRLSILACSALGLGWLLFHGAPGILDAALVPQRRGAAMGALGATPFVAAFFVAVSIHHYFMDHVIWRREHPDVRYLREPRALSYDLVEHHG